MFDDHLFGSSIGFAIGFCYAWAVRVSSSGLVLSVNGYMAALPKPASKKKYRELLETI
ncbi:hypothetical protein [Numidum massiliense]|uniref:hypothetical protein n=1 Tax=Numidum massiliense TaxID=1522315 RepID=UPI0012F826BB|nr:hypothetical protein [Numidum massiliense]